MKERSYDGDYMKDGKRAEGICLAFIRKQPSVLRIEDTRDLRVLREADVDCVMHLMDGRIHLAEIKSDRHLGITGNVLFEVLRVNHTAPADRACTLGWTARSPARWLMYYAPAQQRMYVGEFAALRKAFQAYTQEIRQAVRLDWVNTDSIKSTLNVLIPWNYCKDVFRIYDVSDIANRLNS